MLIGETIISNGDEDQYFYSPWMPYVADNAIFAYQRVYSSLTNPEVVTVQHKRAEAAGADGATVATLSSPLGTTGIFEGQSTAAIDDMWRYRVNLANSSAGEQLHI